MVIQTDLISDHKILYLKDFDRPLNPPILGDFQLIVPSKVDGVGGGKTIF